MYVLITAKFVAASPDLSMLVDVNQRWTSGEPSGFKTGDFGGRIASEYSSGTGLLVAVNRGKMASDHAEMMQAYRRQGLLEGSGFANAKYSIWQSKDPSGRASN